ncbi:MAG: 4-hydroxy-tetrahydrodipicolinate synthase [Clostridia bacterium]|nr:4-hydroxy-tetrahydrodipicolinate synthase [Clostridia bacterium]
MFRGTATALITPFTSDGVDYEGLEKLTEYQIQGGIDALLYLGTTGEPPTITAEEKEDIIRFAVKTVGGRVPVIIGAGSNSTASMVASCKKAEQLGADALLVVTPYYNKCTQEGIFRHYEAAVSSTGLPIFAYNVPGRTGVNILPATARRLAEAFPTIVGLKEASGNMSQILETARLIDGSSMKLYSGDDGLCLPILTAGAEGLISVASNVIPSLMCELVDACLSGDLPKARALQFKYAPLFNALFSEVNPIPAKKACSLLGICSDTVRLPLTVMSEDKAAVLKSAMQQLRLL